MFNFKSKSWLDRFESQNSATIATVQAQAGLEIEVVDFSRGGVGPMWVTGKLGGSWSFLSLGTPRAGWFSWKRQKTWMTEGMTGAMTGGMYHDLGNLRLRPWFHRFLSLCTSGIRWIFKFWN